MKLKWLYILCCFLVVFIALGIVSFLVTFSKSNNTQQYIVVFEDQLDRGALQKPIGRTQNHSSVIKHLKEKTQSQVVVVSYLKSQNALIKSYWIVNALWVETTPDVIEQVSLYPQVKDVYRNYEIELISPVDTLDMPPLTNALNIVNVRKAWGKGYTGGGRIVCSFDTGVEGRHDALKNSWRGNNGASVEESWFDPLYPDSQIPYDLSGHGTHTIGLMVGKTIAETLGVAPDAQWISAAVIDRGKLFDYTIADILSAFEWAVDPDGNPYTVDDVPDVISNSWGIPLKMKPACDVTFWDAIDNVEACGIVVVFAAGNEGPGESTLRTPADRASSDFNAFSVGALKNKTHIAYFSSRGPSLCDSVGNIKPEICAPGMNIRSSYKGNTYKNLSGTSMATPFVAGAVALLRQCDPNVSVNEIKYILLESARDLGDPGNDNTFGYGVLDIDKAINMLSPTFIPDTIYKDDALSGFYLYQNYPNPFNASTIISFDIQVEANIVLQIYNVKGQLVKTLLQKPMRPGFYSVVWEGVNSKGAIVANGVYLYRLGYGDFTDIKKMVFLK